MPRKVFSWFSGGKDSLVATHIAHQIYDDVKVVFINTKIYYPRTYQYVHEVANKLGWELIELETPNDYFELVKKWGFPAPYRRWCAKELKIEVARKFMRKNRGSINVMGIRKAESNQRMNKYAKKQVKYYDHLLRVIIHLPILEWTDKDVMDYIKKHNLPVNPAYNEIGFGGDCLCLAHTSRKQLRRLKAYYPEYLKKIEEIMRETNGWLTHNITVRDLERINKQQCLCLGNLI